MNINPAAALNAYNKVTERTQPVRPTEQSRPEDAAQRAGHTDQIDISPEGARQNEIEQVTRSILSEIKEPASDERIEALRTAMQNGTYHVPTETLVDEVMKHWFG